VVAFSRQVFSSAEIQPAEMNLYRACGGEEPEKGPESRQEDRQEKRSAGWYISVRAGIVQVQ